jgi:hypothetical protein
MDEQDLNLDFEDMDFEDLGGDPEAEADTEIFYSALKVALEWVPVEPPPGSHR